MKQSNDTFEEILKNPLYIAMGSVIGLLVVVLFCVIVWNVAHAETEQTVNPDMLVQKEEIPNQEPDEVVQPEVTATPAPTEAPDPEEEAIKKLVAEQSNDQGVVFTEIRDVVTATGVTNLRSEPSTAKKSETVVTQLENGVNAVRIGYNEEVGWSKLIYNNQVLYASTAYLVVVEEAEE